MDPKMGIFHFSFCFPFFFLPGYASRLLSSSFSGTASHFRPSSFSDSAFLLLPSSFLRLCLSEHASDLWPLQKCDCQ